MLLPAPSCAASAFAPEESVCNESCKLRFQSANKLCSPNALHPPFVSAQHSLSAVLSPMTFCTVELCLSKCFPRLKITPDVRDTGSPAQSLSTCTSSCAFAWLLRRIPQCFSWHSLQVPRCLFSIASMCPAFGCDIVCERHLIASEMPTRSCTRYGHRMVPLRNFVACSLREDWAVLDRFFCLNCAELRPQSLDHVAAERVRDLPATEVHASDPPRSPSIHC